MTCARRPPPSPSTSAPSGRARARREPADDRKPAAQYAVALRPARLLRDRPGGRLLRSLRADAARGAGGPGAGRGGAADGPGRAGEPGAGLVDDGRRTRRGPGGRGASRERDVRRRLGRRGGRRRRVGRRIGRRRRVGRRIGRR
ncbi:hypothetical protein EBO15_25570, partial [Actinomadura harenae]